MQARKNLFNNNNIVILNSKVIVMIPILNPDKQVVIVQQNATQHIINRIQIKWFAKTNNRNVILFPIEHMYTKKDGGQIVDNTNLLTVQDGEKIYIGPGILYYYEKMPACLLTNMNTQLGMVNRA